MLLIMSFLEILKIELDLKKKKKKEEIWSGLKKNAKELGVWHSDKAPDWHVKDRGFSSQHHKQKTWKNKGILHKQFGKLK